MCLSPLLKLTITYITVLYLAKRESYKLTAAKYITYNISDFGEYEYDLHLKCMLVHCGCPIPSSCSIVPVPTTFFIRAFSP